MAKKKPASKLKDIDRLKSIFLAPELDEEDLQENLEKINQWETDLRENENFEEWQESDITKEIIKKARESYKEISMDLVQNRKLTDEERKSIYAKQDAMIWLLSLVYKDVKSNMRAINREIEQALKVVDN